MMDPVVSAIIVTRNRRAELQACLRSLERQRDVALEIIVVDNLSTDGTRQMLADEFPGVTACLAPANLGTSVARNVGIRLARGAYLWFLDSDSEVMDSGHARTLATLLDRDAALGAVGGEAVLNTADRIVGVKRLRLLSNGLTYGEFLCDLDAGALADADCLPTCNLFVRRTAVDAVGGFDPLFFFHLEDLDLTYRIAKAGHALKVIGRVPVVHHFSDVARVNAPFRPHRRRTCFVVKHFGWAGLLLLPVRDVAHLAHPRNLRRLVRFARIADLGTRGFVTVIEGPARAPVEVSRLLRAVRQAATVVVSLAASYVSALPDLRRARRSGRHPVDHLAATDLRGLTIRRSRTRGAWDRPPATGAAAAG